MKEPAGVTVECVESLARRIDERTARIGILGLGYVGIPLARAFHRAGFPVLGFDIDALRIEGLRDGRSPIAHVADADIAQMRASGRFEVSSDPRSLAEIDVALICVPTPVTEHHEPDLSHVRAATEEVTRHLRPGTLVVLESTTYPGTTDEVVRPILESTGLICGESFFLAFSPEREDPGNPTYHTGNIPKLVGGVDATSGAVAAALYSTAIERVITVADARTAEAAKVLENTYRSVNIALVNELKGVFERMGVDIWEAISAAATKPFGFQPFYPGPGLGGHCIPIDPHYLSWRARQFGVTTRLVDVAGEVNASMPDHVLAEVIDALNEEGRALSCSEILVLGVAYKRDVDDTRESPALKIIPRLEARGARVHYHDPHVPALVPGTGVPRAMESVPLDPATIESADVVLIVTDHGDVDYDLVSRHARRVVDTRNCLPKTIGPEVRNLLATRPTLLRTTATVATSPEAPSRPRVGSPARS